MDEILKGNFRTKKRIVEKEEVVDKHIKLKEELKKRTLASLGGSMIYVDRDHLMWDGDGTSSK